MDVIGLDSRRELRALVGRCSDAPPARHSLPLPFESNIARLKKEPSATPRILFMVDVIGLEPMTFRTSSERSSQLS